MKHRLIQIYFYLIASALLILVLFFVSRAYSNIVLFSNQEQNIDALSMGYQNLSRQINIAEALTPGLVKTKDLSRSEQLFIADSQSIVKQLNELKQIAGDSLNKKITANIDAALIPELSWLLTSNVPDSIGQQKAHQHVVNLMLVDSLISYGIEANEKTAEDHKEQLKEAINNVRIWVVIFAMLAGTLLFYTTRSILIKEHKIKNKEQQLETYNQLLQDAQSTAHLGNWEYYPDKEEIHWSDEMYRLWEITKTDVRIKHNQYLDKIYPADKERFLKQQAQFYQDRQSWDIEFRIVTSDQSVKWLYAKAVAVNDHSGQEYFRGTLQDITERKKTEQELKNTNEELRYLSSHLQNVREEERMQIARDIHDELGQQLTGLKMDVSQLRKNLYSTDHAAQRIGGIMSLIDETVQSVRKIASNLRPSILDDLGLIAALEWHSEEVQKRYGIPVLFSTSVTESNLPKPLITGLFRIYQEALTNVIRHAKAGKVISNLNQNNSNLILSVADDGKGIDRRVLQNGKTWGLIGIKERTYLLGGHYELNSEPGKGTQITVTVPLNKIVS